MAVLGNTQRLVLRQFKASDADFVAKLLNTETFIRYIGDRGIRTAEDAEKYIAERIVSSYDANGFGMYLVALNDSDTSIGMCGLVKREELDSPDIGFAFLPEFEGKGYAYEAAMAVLKKDMLEYRLETVLAVTLLDNEKSNALLVKLGFRLRGKTSLYGVENNLYECLGTEAVAS